MRAYLGRSILAALMLAMVGSLLTPMAAASAASTDVVINELMFHGYPAWTVTTSWSSLTGA